MILKHIISLKEKIIAAAFPSRCLVCGEWLLYRQHRGNGICDECALCIHQPEGERCRQCSLPLVSEHRVCLRCRERSYHFDRNISLFEYKTDVRELVYYYKFRQKLVLARFFADAVCRLVQEQFPGLPIIPVPSGRKKTGLAGYNHLKPITDILAGIYKIPVIDCLFRKKAVSQKTLTFEQRLENLKGKIGMKKGITIPSADAVLFDDVYTTGATVDECARILKEHGLQHVFVITLAIDL